MFRRPLAVSTVLALLSAGVTHAASLPAPAPSTAPAQLKVIATVRSTPRCAEIVTHANSAISTALNNDLVISQLITRLRLTNLDDGNPIHHHNGLSALGDIAITLTKQSRSADDEVKRLRALAAASKDPQEQKELKDFADELGGALWKQQKIARDLNGYLASVDFQDMAAPTEDQEKANQAVFGVNDPFSQTPTNMPNGTGTYGQGRGGGILPVPTPPLKPLGHDPNRPTATQEAAAAASDFQSRLPDITLDENHAAQHVSGALARC